MDFGKGARERRKTELIRQQLEPVFPDNPGSKCVIGTHKRPFPFCPIDTLLIIGFSSETNTGYCNSLLNLYPFVCTSIKEPSFRILYIFENLTNLRREFDYKFLLFVTLKRISMELAER